MIKSELLRVLKEQCPDLQAGDVELALKCLLKHMISGLESGERIEICGFGSFTLHHHPPRNSRNPKTGGTLHLRSKSHCAFQAKYRNERSSQCRCVTSVRLPTDGEVRKRD
jgi:integration host factor subunit beta